MFDHMKTTCMALMEGILGNKLNFILHKLPGKLNGHSQYFLTTEMYPDTVATERATKGTSIAKPFGFYEVGLQRDFAPEKLSVRVCDAGGGSNVKESILREEFVLSM